MITTLSSVTVSRGFWEERALGEITVTPVLARTKAPVITNLEASSVNVLLVFSDPPVHRRTTVTPTLVKTKPLARMIGTLISVIVPPDFWEGRVLSETTVTPIPVKITAPVPTQLQASSASALLATLEPTAL